MKLHRAIRSDWSEVAPQQRNIWQRWAACSHGIITPGNIVSIIGAALVIVGLFDIANDQLIGGLAVMLVGRCADVLDGLVADYTKTKSPLGEGVDATIDKILIGLTLIVLLDNQLLPLFVGIVMALHVLYNTVLLAVARKLKIALHPSRSGKLGAVFLWVCVGLYLLSDILKNQHHSASLTMTAAVVSFIVYVIMAAWSSRNYTQNVYYKQKMRA